MWILQEPYEDPNEPIGGGWSLVGEKELNSSGALSNKTWETLTWIIFGFRHNLQYDDMDYLVNDPSMMEELKKTAIINVSKMPAVSRTSYLPRKKVDDWKDIVKQQIDVYNLYLLVTLRLIEKSFIFM